MTYIERLESEIEEYVTPEDTQAYMDQRVYLLNSLPLVDSEREALAKRWGIPPYLVE